MTKEAFINAFNNQEILKEIYGNQSKYQTQQLSEESNYAAAGQRVAEQYVEDNNFGTAISSILYGAVGADIAKKTEELAKTYDLTEEKKQDYYKLLNIDPDSEEAKNISD